MVKPSAGVRVGERYELVDAAADRGLGACWRARDLQRGGAEVLVEFLGTDDDAGLRAALRPVRLFRDPAVAAVVQHGDSDGARFVVYEWVAGDPLAARLQGRGGAPIELSRARAIGERVAAAVEAGHRASPAVFQGIVAPVSVIVSARGAGVDVKLLDFGLASFARSGDARVSIAQAPEGWRGERASVQTDVFAVGALWTELLSVPAAGGLARRDDVPESVWSVIAEALAIDPSARFESVESFMTALDAAWSHASGRTASSGRSPSLLESIVQRGPSLTAPVTVAAAPMSAAAVTGAPILGPMPDLAPSALNPWSSAVLSAEVAVPVPARPPLESTLVERVVPTTDARAVFESTVDVKAAPDTAFQRPSRRLEAGEATFERERTQRGDELHTTLPLPTTPPSREAAIAPAPAPRRRPPTQDVGAAPAFGSVAPVPRSRAPLDETLDSSRRAAPVDRNAATLPLPPSTSALPAPLVGAGLALAVLAVAAVVYAFASR